MSCTADATWLHHGCLVGNRVVQPWMTAWVIFGYALQVQELAQAAGEDNLQDLYSFAPQLLSSYCDQLSCACALLQVCS